MLVPVLVVLSFLVLLYIGVQFAAAWVSAHPFRTPLFLSPGAMGAIQENLTIRSPRGVDLAAWWLPKDNPKGVVVLCHGYMMNRSEPSSVAKWLWDQGFACLLFDFPAHGRSGGKRCGLGWAERHDVLAACRWVEEKWPEVPLYLWGSSMGAAAVAFALESGEISPKAVILDCPYSRLRASIAGWWQFLGGDALRVILAPTVLFAPIFLKHRLDRADVGRALSKSSVPVLLLCGGADTLVPPTEARRNQEMCPTAVIHFFEDCNHSEARWNLPEQYFEVVRAFLSRL